MAFKLADVVFRRTSLGAAGYPGGRAIQRCASLIAREQGWDEERRQREVDEVNQLFLMMGATPSASDLPVTVRDESLVSIRGGYR
jgi:glycerol-3-phosphate dehydrogenase